MLELWPRGTPGAPEVPPAEVVRDREGGGDRHVSGVHRPTITAYLPVEGASPWPAVVICPGGGYGLLALDKEGHDVARWFAERGVVGVVLKYRLPRPAGHVYGHEAPLADAARALALVRQRSEDWGVDVGRVGIMGFSAGGHLAASASVQLGEAGPNFSVLVYPVISMVAGVTHGVQGESARTRSRSSAGRALLERAAGHRGHSAGLPRSHVRRLGQGRELLALLLGPSRGGVSAELHVFARGGHGYGMRRPDLPVGRWPELLDGWIKNVIQATD